MPKIELIHKSQHPTQHIIFIHGLGGHLKETWCSSTEKDVFWPLWLTEGNEHINIWTIGYDASPISYLGRGDGIPACARKIYELLLSESSLQDGEIVFIGHSLGGLITKKIILIAKSCSELDKQRYSFLNRITKVGFLGTPHHGSDYVALIEFIYNSLKFLTKDAYIAPLFWFFKLSRFMKTLERNHPDLKELNLEYRNLCQTSCIEHLILTEGKATKGFFIVKPDSSDPGLKQNPIEIDVNHTELAKPSSQEDCIFKYVANLIQKKICSQQELWLQSNFGLTCQGWQGYGNWALVPVDGCSEYIHDSEIRFKSAKSGCSENIIDGINTTREILSSQSCVRLIGLSGVGKTRFAQALFDESIGEKALDKNSVFYLDANESMPVPTPEHLLRTLIEKKKEPSVIILDNCSSETHKTLSDILKTSTCLINLLTIEYDIRDDIQEGTSDILVLEGMSTNVLSKILEQNKPTVNSELLERVAELAMGNARIATLLLNNIESKDNLSELTDEVLFKKLFTQRHQEDGDLEHAAEALSLVYSFKFVEEDGYSSDLELLGKLSEIEVSKLYRSATELKKRDLAQQRHLWMAILPHPLANRLAKQGLDKIADFHLNKYINENSSKKFLVSFSRRIGYLNNSERATKIAKRWIKQDNLFDKLLQKSEGGLGVSILYNIAPIIQEEVLQFLVEKFEDEKVRKNIFHKDNLSEILKLIRALAYETNMFAKAIGLLVKLYQQDENFSLQTRSIILGIFQPYLSGTVAPIEMRLQQIEQLINSNVVKEKELALELLANLLSTHCSSSHEYSFGMLPRGFGLEPAGENLYYWYTSVIGFSINLLQKDNSYANKLKPCLAESFKELWKITKFQTYLYQMAVDMKNIGPWTEGWSEITLLMNYNTDEELSNSRDKLLEIKDFLTPSVLDSKIKFYILSESDISRGLDKLDVNKEFLAYGCEELNQLAENIGQECVQNNLQVFTDNLTQIISYNSHHAKLKYFGKGCANGARDPLTIWELIKNEILHVSESEVCRLFLLGFIVELDKINNAQCIKILDEIYSNSSLSYLFALLQTACTLSEQAISRLKQLINTQEVNAWDFQSLVRDNQDISDKFLIEILDAFWSKKEQKTVHHLLSDKFSFSKDDITPLIYDYSWKILSETEYNSNLRDHDINRILEGCINKNLYHETSQTFLKNFVLSYQNTKKFYGPDAKNFLKTVIRYYFKELVTFFFEVNDENLWVRLENQIRLKLENTDFDDSVITPLQAYCRELEDVKLTKIAHLIIPFTIVNNEYKWTIFAKDLLAFSKTPRKILNIYCSPYLSGRACNSRTYRQDAFIPLLEELQLSSTTEIAEEALIILEKIKAKVDKEMLEEQRTINELEGFE